MKPEEEILAKLEQCKPYYEYLVELRPALLKPDADFVLWGAVERYLQLVLECAIDVGEMLIALEGLERAE